MYCSMVSAIASTSSSSEYSWSESRLKLGDLNSSRLRVLKCLLDDQNSRSVGFVPKKDRKFLARKSIIENLESASVPDDRYAKVGYAVSNGSGYAVFSCRPEQCLEVSSIRRIQGLDTAYWGFLGVLTTLDIFENIHILYLEYGVLSISGYGILNFIHLWSLYTWVYFLRTKDEAPDLIIAFINQVQRNLKAQILTIRTDNGTEFKNEKLQAFYAKLAILQNFYELKLLLLLVLLKIALLYTWYNKTPYELIRGRKPNIQYFHVFGSLCYPTNDRDDLGKMKLKADIGIFIGYSESSRGFQYYATSIQEVSDNSAANTLDNEHTSSSSSIVVEEDEAPQIVSSPAEQVVTEPNSPVLNENADEFVQEDVADFDVNVFYNAPPTHVFKEAESSSTYQDPSNMHEFHQKHRSSDRWTKNHPIEQVISDPSKPVMIRNRLQTYAEVCMYALTVSTIKLKNIKEAMLDVSWIESMQDKLNQFKRFDV
ncbi:gag-pol polyprotein [Tanacetum coccineum]